MDFAEEIASLGKKSQQFGERFKPEQINEELTKNALIMPFIRALGYDIFDPMEVVPEFSAAIGEYKDARVDYAILRDGKPIIIVECKAYGSELDAKKCNQLMLYFHGTQNWMQKNAISSCCTFTELKLKSLSLLMAIVTSSLKVTD